jgi:hypothetical protein
MERRRRWRALPRSARRPHPRVRSVRLPHEARFHAGVPMRIRRDGVDGRVGQRTRRGRRLHDEVGPRVARGARVIGIAMELPVHIHIAVRRCDADGCRAEGRGTVHRVKGAGVEGGDAAWLRHPHPRDLPRVCVEHDLQDGDERWGVERVLAPERVQRAEPLLGEDGVDRVVHRDEVRREGASRAIERARVGAADDRLVAPHRCPGRAQGGT